MSESTVPEIPTAEDTDVFITRMFAAPRDVVWRFFTDPDLLATWFGPATVHVDRSTVEVDLRVGGAWNLDMVDNATAEHYPIRAELTAVVVPEYFEGKVVGPPGTVTLRVWLHDHGDRTRMTLHQGPFDPEFRDMTVDGWLESFDKIDAQLGGAA